VLKNNSWKSNTISISTTELGKQTNTEHGEENVHYRWKHMPMYTDAWIKFNWRNLVWLRICLNKIWNKKRNKNQLILEWGSKEEQSKTERTTECTFMPKRMGVHIAHHCFINFCDITNLSMMISALDKISVLRAFVPFLCVFVMLWCTFCLCSQIL